RGTSPERNEWDAMLSRNPHDFLHLFGRVWPEDRIRLLICNPGQRMAVLGPNGLSGLQAIAESASEHRNGCCHALARMVGARCCRHLPWSSFGLRTSFILGLALVSRCPFS